MNSCSRSRWRDRSLYSRFLIISLLTCTLAIALTDPVLAQLPSTGNNATPGTLRPLGVKRYGNLEVTWVTSPLTRQELFQIVAPAITDRSDLTQMQLAVEVRAKNIENLIWLETTRFRERMVARIFTPDSNIEAERSALLQLMSRDRITPSSPS